MRTLKFRAWDRKKKIFPLIGFDIMGECTVFDLVKQYRLQEHSDLIIQQFTGLLDRNNKEIYEGDVVRDNQGQFYQIIFDNKFAKFELSTTGFVNTLSRGSYHTMIHESNLITVVDNIFELPGKTLDQIDTPPK